VNIPFSNDFNKLLLVENKIGTVFLLYAMQTFFKQINFNVMKRIFTLSALVLAVSLFLGGCVKDSFNNGGGFDESYWLAKEKGDVVYSDPYCSYYVVETYYGYNVVRAYGGYKPGEGAVVYGNFSSKGTRDIYNRSSGVIFTGTITDFWLTYTEAQDALDYYCPLGTGKAARVFKASTFKK
jgi:hypothetical protein